MVGQLGKADPLADIDGEAFLDAVLALEKNEYVKLQVARPCKSLYSTMGAIAFSCKMCCLCFLKVPIRLPYTKFDDQKFLEI